MLGNFDDIVDNTFYQGKYENKTDPTIVLIVKNLNSKKPSKMSLTVLNSFMELVVFLDMMYSNDPGQKDFFIAFKDPFIYTLAKSYDPKWLKFSDQTKEFFALKVRPIR